MTLITREQALRRQVMAFSALGAGGAPVARGSAGAAEVRCEEVADGNVTPVAERIRELEATLQHERADRQKSLEAAFTAGSIEGKAQAESDAADRLSILRQAIGRATLEFADAMNKRSDIAVAIARSALSKVLGDDSAYGPMVEDIIRHQLTQIVSGSVIGIRVSPDDFADEARFAALSTEHAGVRITRDPTLSAGSCLFDLTLGAIDASIDVQANALDQLLAPLSAATGSAQ